MNPHERPVVTEDNKTAVRAGSTGNNVRYVLIASCALVIVAFIAIALFAKP
jgi:Flp pilus assembly protein TadB